MNLQKTLAIPLALLFLQPQLPAANHREAPITSLDRTADITDWYAFVSYDDPTKATMILNVDPLLEPSNGPNYFPFDPGILYQMHVDNDRDGIEDITFQFRFTTEQRLPGVFTALVGAGAGVSAQPGSPNPGAPVVPPAITALDGNGSVGLGLRQFYSVTMINKKTNAVTDLTQGQKLFAVPTNVGSRTMPNYAALAQQGIYSLSGGVKVFAGTVDDPFYIDLGATFDSLNFRNGGIGGSPGVLTPAQDANDTTNFASDSVSGFNVNSIAIEVPIAMLVKPGTVLTGGRPSTSDVFATIGTYGQTSRARTTVRRSPDPMLESGGFRPVQRMGNPLINEVLIGTGSKDRFSMSEPKDDGQFAAFFLDPLLARVLNAVFGIPIPSPNRVDLLPLVTYAPPIAAAGPGGPVADLLRVNLGVGPTAQANRKRMGLLAGDAAGFPNGRRVSDDVVDIATRAVAGILTGQPQYGNLLGDAVNANDVPYRETFPYVGLAHSGKDRRHIDPGEPLVIPASPSNLPVN